MNKSEWENWCLKTAELSSNLRRWADSSQSLLGMDDLVGENHADVGRQARIIAYLKEAAYSLESAVLEMGLAE